jgi:hypothetical protein
MRGRNAGRETSVTFLLDHGRELREREVRTFGGPSRITDGELSCPSAEPHDGVVHPTSTPGHPRGRSRSTRTAGADLERFWPSRRGHAFDELCR